MRLPEIERLCRSIVPGAGRIDLEALGAGLISETYRVARDGSAYTLKIAAEPPGLGWDLPWELRVLERAGSIGVAPRLEYCDVDAAVLLSRWAEGRSWTAHEAGAAANIERFAALLRRVHSLAIPLPPREVTPLQWIHTYDAALSRRASPSPDPPSRDPALRSAALARTQALQQLPRAGGVLCHSDLHSLNVLQQDEALILLDWEYAHVADPLWDVAGWCANNDLEAEMQRHLLTCYLGSAPISSQWRRFRLLLALYDYVCLLWSHLYLTVRGEGAKGVADRSRLLDARLRLPAHYAA